MIRSRIRIPQANLILLGILSGAACGAMPRAASAQEQPLDRGIAAKVGDIDYLAQIKPLLRERCYTCHGALKQEAGLRLDTAASALRGGDSGPAAVKGDAAASLLLARVTAADVAERMPPEFEGEPLSAEEVAKLRDWIAAGAPAPQEEQPELDPRDHWAFRPIVRPRVPTVSDPAWGHNPIDAFIARDYERLELRPQAEASRLTLLRRLSFDLIGLPPSPEEISAVQKDDGTDWYERAAARLLDDPRHGERWARHWMDIWRYSDWWGLGDQLRNSQKHIWHWRDWIVESLNEDAPYDEMVRLMLAADEIRPEDPSALRASGFLARNYFLFNRNQWMDETVEHVAKGFLGLTVNCAKCHDHKYDPIEQTDYYRLRAIFEPYHVRLDVVPGEADLERDGLPRAFDGRPDEPTYRFIRGQESNPDKSSVVAPGIPAALAFEPLKIIPVDLPETAWQPERREWVAGAYRATALRNVATAEARVSLAREKLDAAERSAGDAIEARLELLVVERSLEAARAELESVERRAAAMEAGRLGTSGAESEARATARESAVAERQLAVAKAQVAVAEAELRLHRAAEDQKEAAGKEVAAAREALEKARKAVEQPGEQFTKLVGARWTPTRFLSSLNDDPEVTFPPRSTGRRRALADWIVDRRNPLAARVAVNHLWARHMGKPLVATVFDFGRKGSPPSHPELLDWLAAELIDSGWSMKHLHRLIVESAVYRLSASAAGAEEVLSRDPDNVRYWRRTPIRLESQAVRDSIVALAGTLDLRMGGPPIPASNQADSTRRSLYFFHSNNERNLFLTTFDEALVKECYRREQSIVPQQALALTNSRLVLDAAGPIAGRITEQLDAGSSPADDDAFARQAFIVLLASDADDAEAALMTRALKAWKGLPESADGTAGTSFARANLVRVLLNHSDFVTLR